MELGGTDPYLKHVSISILRNMSSILNYIDQYILLVLIYSLLAIAHSLLAIETRVPTEMKFDTMLGVPGLQPPPPQMTPSAEAGS